jgi:acyl dehydratase
VALKPGWRGRAFEDFEVGDVYEHPLGRTTTQADNIWFTLLTVNNNPSHFDAAYAARTECRGRHSLFVKRSAGGARVTLAAGHGQREATDDRR